MKKIGTLNAPLSALIARMGHTDRLVVCDCGLPIPHGFPVVDLALRHGLPGFLDTLEVVLQELKVERAVFAEELAARGGSVHDGLLRLLDGIPTEQVPHEVFKQESRLQPGTAFVRTGEASPYANVILISGVTF